MGVDLKLLVVDGRTGNSSGFSHTLIEFGRYYWLFDRLNKVARTVPGFKLSSYVARIPDGSWQGENGYGDVEKTPYGNPLTYVSAAEFLKCADEEAPAEWEHAKAGRYDPFALAAVAYLRELSPDTWIGLYYH